MIQYHHKPDQPIRSCKDSKHGCPPETKGLGDRVEQLAKPIATAMHCLGPKLIQLGKWMQTIGKPNSTCGCESRKACLNALELSLHHPFKSCALILNCLRK